MKRNDNVFLIINSEENPFYIRTSKISKITKTKFIVRCGDLNIPFDKETKKCNYTGAQYIALIPKDKEEEKKLSSLEQKQDLKIMESVNTQIAQFKINNSSLLKKAFNM